MEQIKSDECSIEFETCVKGTVVEAIPAVSALGLRIEYRLKRGKNYIASNNGRTMIFTSIQQAQGYAKRVLSK